MFRAKRSSVRPGENQEIGPGRPRPLKASASQLIVNAGSTNAIENAMEDAKGYNIVASSQRSRKRQLADGKGKPSSNASDQHSAAMNAERIRVSESVKSIIMREQARDEQLAQKLKKINEKQAKRIK
mgnify:CR=1 FL=1